MFRDYPARFRTEEYIAEHARNVRMSLGLDHQTKIVLHQVVNALKGRKIGEKGKFEFVTFASNSRSEHGFVKFDPPKMHLDDEVWNFAKYEDPFSNFVIAHELGHLFLHENDLKSFSAKGEIKSIYGQDERSAEWQANIFAYHFIAPTHVIATMSDWREIKDRCNLNQEVAKDRFKAVRQLLLPKRAAPRFSLQYQGDPCPKCSNFTLVQCGTCLKCDTCKSTVGCN